MKFFNAIAHCIFMAFLIELSHCQQSIGIDVAFNLPIEILTEKFDEQKNNTLKEIKLDYPAMISLQDDFTGDYFVQRMNWSELYGRMMKVYYCKKTIFESQKTQDQDLKINDQLVQNSCIQEKDKTSVYTSLANGPLYISNVIKGTSQGNTDQFNRYCLFAQKQNYELQVQQNELYDQYQKQLQQIQEEQQEFTKQILKDSQIEYNYEEISELIELHLERILQTKESIEQQKTLIKNMNSQKSNLGDNWEQKIKEAEEKISLQEKVLLELQDFSKTYQNQIIKEQIQELKKVVETNLFELELNPQYNEITNQCILFQNQLEKKFLIKEELKNQKNKMIENGEEQIKIKKDQQKELLKSIRQLEENANLFKEKIFKKQNEEILINKLLELENSNQQERDLMDIKNYLQNFFGNKSDIPQDIQEIKKHFNVNGENANVLKMDIQEMTKEVENLWHQKQQMMDQMIQLSQSVDDILKKINLAKKDFNKNITIQEAQIKTLSKKLSQSQELKLNFDQDLIQQRKQLNMLVYRFNQKTILEQAGQQLTDLIQKKLDLLNQFEQQIEDRNMIKLFYQYGQSKISTSNKGHQFLQRCQINSQQRTNFEDLKFEIILGEKSTYLLLLSDQVDIKEKQEGVVEKVKNFIQSLSKNKNKRFFSKIGDLTLKFENDKISYTYENKQKNETKNFVFENQNQNLQDYVFRIYYCLFKHDVVTTSILHPLAEYIMQQTCFPYTQAPYPNKVKDIKESITLKGIKFGFKEFIVQMEGIISEDLIIDQIEGSVNLMLYQDSKFANKKKQVTDVNLNHVETQPQLKIHNYQRLTVDSLKFSDLHSLYEDIERTQQEQRNQKWFIYLLQESMTNYIHIGSIILSQIFLIYQMIVQNKRIIFNVDSQVEFQNQQQLQEAIKSFNDIKNFTWDQLINLRQESEFCCFNQKVEQKQRERNLTLLNPKNLCTCCGIINCYGHKLDRFYSFCIDIEQFTIGMLGMTQDEKCQCKVFDVESGEKVFLETCAVMCSIYSVYLFKEFSDQEIKLTSVEEQFLTERQKNFLRDQRSNNLWRHNEVGCFDYKIGKFYGKCCYCCNKSKKKDQITSEQKNENDDSTTEQASSFVNEILPEGSQQSQQADYRRLTEEIKNDMIFNDKEELKMIEDFIFKKVSLHGTIQRILQLTKKYSQKKMMMTFALYFLTTEGTHELYEMISIPDKMLREQTFDLIKGQKKLNDYLPKKEAIRLETNELWDQFVNNDWDEYQIQENLKQKGLKWTQKTRLTQTQILL